MTEQDEEERQLRSVALQNAAAILGARQRAERDLEAERERLRITLASIGDAVITTGPDGRVTFLNGVAESLTGWTLAEATGRPLPEIFRIVDEFSREPVEDPAVRALRAGAVVGLANHTILIARDGTERPIDDSAAPMRDGAGNPVGAVLVFRDATERRRAEEVRARLAAIVESSEDAIVSKTLDGEIRSWNAGAERLFGYTAAEAVGRSITLIIPPERLDEERMILGKIRSGERVEHYETVRVAKDGRRIDISLTVSPIRSTGGEIIGASKVAHDITDQKRAERRMGVQHAVTRALSESATLAEAAPAVLRAVCEYQGWEFAALWSVDKAEGVVRCSDVWLAPSLVAPRFESITRGARFRQGVGLPGRVWAEARPLWVPDVTAEGNFPRAPAAAAEGLHGALACPVVLGGEVLGVVEFFSREVRPPDEDLLRMMAGMGSQIGQFLERKRAEEALRRSEAQFRQMADGMPQIVWTARPDGFIDYYNERWYEFTGFPRNEYGDESWKPILHPDDVRRCVDTYYGCIRSGSLYQIEYRLKDRRTGGYRWFLGRAHPLRDEAGRIVRWFGTCTDIDDTKRGEEANRFLADASAALAELTDFESTLQKVAGLAVPFFADWCGVDVVHADGSVRRLAVTHSDPAKVAWALELARRYPPDPSDPHGVMRVLRTGEPEWVPVIPDDMLAELSRDAEHLRTVRGLGLKSYICVPLRSRARVLGALTFATAESGRVYDADDLRAAEDLAHRAVIAIENANLLAALRETDRRKDEFLALLAHELRNPLAPLRSGVEVLRLSGGEPDAVARARDRMDRQLTHLVRLVDDLLDVSRISRGKMELRRERVRLADVVGSAVETARPLTDAAGHTLRVSLPDDPVPLDADLTRLAQVFANLLTNSAKYTPHGGKIWLTAARDGAEVVVTVRDTGIGIPAGDLARIFDMFSQVDRSIERSTGGLGIGLALVKGLVEMHGGTVRAESPGVGAGSTFTVRLPVVVPEAAAAPVAEPAADGHAPRAAGRRVLVVDDNRDGAESLAEMLRLLGHEPYTAHDGLEAVEAAGRLRPDLVLMDVGMPRLNGLDATVRIRAQPWGRKVRIVALTGWGQEGDRVRSREAGCDGHLVKPVSLVDLQRLLAEPGGGGDRG